MGPLEPARFAAFSSSIPDIVSSNSLAKSLLGLFWVYLRARLFGTGRCQLLLLLIADR